MPDAQNVTSSKVQRTQSEERVSSTPSAETTGAEVRIEPVVHGDPQNQQPSEAAFAVPLASSIPVVQVDTAIPQSAANVTPQDPYELHAPAILPKDLNPVPAPETSGEAVVPAPIATSETHLSGQPPSAQLPETPEQIERLPDSEPKQ